MYSQCLHEIADAPYEMLMSIVCMDRQTESLKDHIIYLAHGFYDRLDICSIELVTKVTNYEFEQKLKFQRPKNESSKPITRWCCEEIYLLKSLGSNSASKTGEKNIWVQKCATLKMAF